MRTVKASEVVKGMRVRVEQRFTHPPLVKGGAEDETIETIEGTVTVSANANITFANGDTRYLRVDYPVTVLAEPEPEWVEGAWYRVEINGNKTHAKRVEGGWVRWDGAAYPTWEDIDRSRVVTVLGRVLIVDWPGDDVARELETNGGHHNGIGLGPIKKVCRAVAYAIRTQGGAR